MQELLRPFGEPEKVQENLVTRNGEVEMELERMRMLLARVGGRVGMLGFKDGDSMDLDDDRDEEEEEGRGGGGRRGTGGDTDDWERKKLEGVLDSF